MHRYWSKDLPVAERIWRVALLAMFPFFLVGMVLGADGDSVALTVLTGGASCVVSLALLVALVVERRTMNDHH